MPLFDFYGVELWVPEVGGPIDPASEAHDLIMSVFGGMSKGERNRIKIRVRTAMASQAKIEGRYLGGRPPYGYRLADAGPHPNPAKAADGKHLHRLEPHPQYAPTVRWIFQQYLAGRGLYTIAEELTAAGIASPSQADPERNAHRTGEGWSKSAVRVILTNPRNTGRQVWNRQRKQEVLLDVENVADGYEAKLKWNAPDSWVWSDHPAHEPLISIEDFEHAQQIRHSAQRGATRERTRVNNVYVLRGLFYCALCGRKMQGQHGHGHPYYRCSYPREYALADHVKHPLNVYVQERDVLPALDDWLATLFAPHRIDDTVRTLAAYQETAQPVPTTDLPDDDSDAMLAECDAKLAKYRAALEAGVDAETVGVWITAAKTERAAIAARSVRAHAAARPNQLLSEGQIAEIVRALGDIRAVIGAADPGDKAQIYKRLGLQLTYKPALRIVRAQITLDPNNRGVMVGVRGGT